MDSLGKTSKGAKTWLVAVVVAAVGAALAACGGGGSQADPLAGDTTAAAWADGPISGLGSIIVNGVRYDDSGAHVESEDGSLHDSRSLKVGMMVELRSSKVDDSAQTAKASSIRFGSELVGPIASIDAAGSSIQVLDQTVAITSNTVFDDSLSGGLTGLRVGAVVEIHALRDAATGRFTATRIEDKPGATMYRLRGVVSGLDTATKTFAIGGARIAYAGASEVSSNLANDQKVRVTLQTTAVGGVWQAIGVRSGLKRVDDASDGRIHGTVTAFTSNSAFEVNGMRVDASGAKFESGASALGVGVYVRVRGTVVNGVLVASQVKVDGDHSSDSMDRVEIHGTISGLDTSAKTFVVRDVKVNYAGSIDWHDGNQSNLANGRKIAVKGAWSNDHSTLVAAKIEFES